MVPSVEATPAYFPRVVGHAAARRALGQAIAAGRLTDSLLLCGPEGVGRSLLAREVAKALNCTGAGALPCAECPPCRRIERGTFADLHLLTTGEQASIGIEAVQDLLAELALAPVEGRTRVFVVDPAGALTEPAQHALLKGLEEPPPRALLVLIAAHEGQVLPTIASRCRTVRLQELSPHDVREVLRRAGLDEAQADARARWAGGSPGQALSDEALAFAALAEDAAAALATGEAYGDPMGVVDRVAAAVGGDGVEAAVRRGRLLGLVRALARTLRDALVEREAPGTGLALSGAGAHVLGPLSALPAGRLATAIDRLAAAEEEVAQNINPALVLEGLVIDLGATLTTDGAHAGARDRGRGGGRS